MLLLLLKGANGAGGFKIDRKQNVKPVNDF